MQCAYMQCRDVRTREVGIQEIHHKVRPYEVNAVLCYSLNENFVGSLFVFT